MPVYSMTGYANAVSSALRPGGGASGEALIGGPATASEAPAVTLELRSVNSRFLDLAFRLPDEMRALEPALRELLAGAFRRGKIELRIASASHADAAWPQPQAEQLNRLASLQAAVRGWLPGAKELSVHEVMQWCKGGHAQRPLDEDVLKAARSAIAGLKAARAREGARLAQVLAEGIARLRELAAQCEPLIPAVIERQQQKFRERWQQALETSGGARSISAEATQERALNEAAAYAIRIDVAEELARLRSHLDEIDRLLEAGGEVGKRLDFLVQELLREANTLASKAASVELTTISVEMKVSIEQLREQVQNLE